MISGAGRASTLAVASGGRGRGKVAAVSLMPSFPPSLNIGAGCGPACSSTPFTTIATVASSATPKASASRRLQPKRASAAKRGVLPSLLLLRLDLGTDLHQPVDGALGCRLDGRRGRTRNARSDRRHLG